MMYLIQVSKIHGFIQNLNSVCTTHVAWEPNTRVYYEINGLGMGSMTYYIILIIVFYIDTPCRSSPGYDTGRVWCPTRADGEQNDQGR